MKAHKQPKITLGVIIGISFAFTLIALFAVGSKVIFGSPDTPRLLNYQGKLTDSDGPVTGTVSIIFTIYDAGGTPIWTETHGNITVKNGLFNAILAESEGLAVVKKSAREIIVKELRSGRGNYNFDYIVQGVRKGFEDFQVIRDKRTGFDELEAADVAEQEVLE